MLSHFKEGDAPEGNDGRGGMSLDKAAKQHSCIGTSLFAASN
jgi:hypothetical protein